MTEQTGQHIISGGLPPIINRIPAIPPGEAARTARAVEVVTKLPANGSTTIYVVPPRPCALSCVAELHIAMGHGSQLKVHISDEQRRALVEALGGTWPA